MKFNVLGKNVSIELIDNWKSAWRYLTVQFMAFVAFAPDIYNILVTQGWVEANPAPGSLSYILKTVALICVVLRLLKQNMPKPPDDPPGGAPGEV